jgi:TP901 family phage tail tape measure protein
VSDLKVSLVLQLKNLLGRRLKDVRGDVRGLKKDVEGLSSGTKAAAGNLTVLAGLSRVALAIGGIGGAMKLTAGNAISFEKAMAQVRKKVDGADDPVVYAAIEAEVKRMALAYGIAQTEMAQLVAEAGASGVAVKDLAQFMNVAAKAAVGWDMSAQDAAQALAQIKAGAQLTTAEIAELADKINYLGDSSAAKERDIVDMFQRASEAARAAGSDTNTTLAFLTGARSMGVAPEVAARWFGAFTSKLVNPTKKGTEALKGLGLSFDKVKEGMEIKPFETMVDVLDRLKDSAKRAEFAKDLFGQEWFDETLRVAGGLKEVQKAYTGLQNPANFRGSLDKGLKIELATTAKQLDRLKVLVSDIGDRLGRWALPPINAAIEKLIGLMDRLSGVTEYDKQKRAADQTMKAVADFELGAADKRKQAEKLDADARTTRDRKDRATLEARAKRAREEAEKLQQQADDARELGRAGALTALSGRSEKQNPNDTVAKVGRAVSSALNDPLSDPEDGETADRLLHRLNALNYARKKPELQDRQFQDRIRAAEQVLRDRLVLSGGNVDNTDAAREAAETTRRAREITRLKAEIEQKRTSLANIPGSNPFGSNSQREKSAGRRQALEADIRALQLQLQELEGTADKTGAAVRDKLTLDLTSQGANAGVSWAAGLRSAAPAVAAAVAELRAPILTPAAPIGGAGRPATGGGARTPSVAPSVQVGGITINGASDPERTARLVERRLASAVRSGLTGAHHDGVV